METSGSSERPWLWRLGEVKHGRATHAVVTPEEVISMEVTLLVVRMHEEARLLEGSSVEVMCVISPCRTVLNVDRDSADDHL